ncbi:glycoside hydrolase family 32 protein [Aliiglaciecola lipolytica]|uniref:Levanase n=1 Tax=Aliiglaciecola lipolytica E3 TaxID=1127673 RepID=K6Y673_9ALTE|nr:glycoside hydrolase family 32 protein [Aliiglaciecola lipolytica]GAC13727.1 levanase [Aliiglaciecola lipolytica E3]
MTQQNKNADTNSTTEAEAFRPKYHFTPAENWMNDPNGMVYYAGEYHLFYQYHPESTVWGPMHWGHAVSRDMVNWEHLPIALFPDELGTIFSGSAVVDWNNTSGLGTKDNPPMVAIFTYHNAKSEKAGNNDFQTQGIAYSTDKGRTWTKYSANPVLNNPGKVVFRDPKVSWHEPSQRWIMVLAQGDNIGFYSSTNLRDWVAESSFGQNWGEHGGVWECPDLIRVNVSGTDEYKYVLIVSVMPGAPNGGSGTQYFIGDFDGSVFTLAPEIQNALQPIPGVFPKGQVFEDFEGDFKNWTVSGSAFGNTPAKGAYGNQQEVTGFNGNGLANSFNTGDEATGRLSSHAFTLTHPFINFYVGGGSHVEQTAVNLLINGKVVRSTSGPESEKLQPASWDVGEFIGQSASIEIVDSAQGGWGHILADQFVFANEPANAAKHPALWLDYGTDNYAGVTFSDVPKDDGRLMLMGWMSNWFYANQVPTQKWRSAMTIPRSLSLQNTRLGLRLISKPVTELDFISIQQFQQDNLQVHKETPLFSDVDLRAGSNRLRISLKDFNGKELVFEYLNSLQEKVSITVDVLSKQMLIDRTQSGNVDFEARFAGVQHGLLDTDFNHLEFDIFYDNSSIEVFVNGGELVMSALVFPNEPFNKITLSSDTQTHVEKATLDLLSADIK